MGPLVHMWVPVGVAMVLLMAMSHVCALTHTDLLVAGDYFAVSTEGVQMAGIGWRLHNDTWTSVGTLGLRRAGQVRKLTLLPRVLNSTTGKASHVDDMVALGGTFRWVHGVPMHAVATFDPVTKQYAPVAQGCDGDVTSISWIDDEFGITMIVAGDITVCYQGSIDKPVSVPVHSIATYSDAQGWRDKGQGSMQKNFNGILNAMSVLWDASTSSHNVFTVGYQADASTGTIALLLQRLLLGTQVWSTISSVTAASPSDSWSCLEIMDGETALLAMGGSFGNLGSGNPTNNVAIWNGFSWQSLGGGTNGRVFDLLYVSSGPGSGSLIVAGAFTHVGGTLAVPGIAQWVPGKGWFALSDGNTFHGSVPHATPVMYALALSNGLLAVGGQFNITIGGVNGTKSSSVNIATMDMNSTVWSIVPSSNDVVSSLTVTDVLMTPNHTLYVWAENEYVRNVFATFSLDTDVDPYEDVNGFLRTGNALAVSGTRESIWIGGQYLWAGSETTRANNVAHWTPEAGFEPLQEGVTGLVSTLHVLDDGSVFVGGSFSVIGDAMGSITGLARYWPGNQTWSAPGFSTGWVVGGFAETCAPLRSTANGDNSTALIVGGLFSLHRGNGSVWNTLVAVWNVTSDTWHPLPGPAPKWDSAPYTGLIPYAASLDVTSSGSMLLIGGFFSLSVQQGNQTLLSNSLALLNISSGVWHELPPACDPSASSSTPCSSFVVEAAVRRDTDNSIFIGGTWEAVGVGQSIVSAAHVAKLSGGKWTSVGVGTGGTIYVLKLSPSGSLIAGGQFTTAGGNQAHNLAEYYDDQEWVSLTNFGLKEWTDRAVHDVALVHVVTPPSVAPPTTAPSAGVPTLQPTTSPTTSVSPSGLATKWKWLIIVLSSVAGIAVLCLVVYKCARRSDPRRGYRELLPAEGLEPWLDQAQSSGEAHTIAYEELDIVNPPVGKGAATVVNKATLRGTVVAVKTFINDYQMMGGDAEAEFKREIQTLLSLRHPNVLLLIGYVRQPRCIVTEYAARGCVYDVINQMPLELSWARILSLALDTARGLAYLHAQRPPMLHRDVKSLNILVTEAWVGKVADFGISRSFVLGETMTIRAGTLRWMAPEVFQHQGDNLGSFYTTKCDVYSFGIVIWEMIVKELPWAHVPFDYQIEDRITRDGEMLSLDLPNGVRVPGPLHDLIMACWHLDPSDRPSFADIIPALESMVAPDGGPYGI